jgi:hypothetical protein
MEEGFEATGPPVIELTRATIEAADSEETGGLYEGAEKDAW